MSVTDLQALIAEVEAATEGSRELDRKIALHLGWLRWPPGKAKESGIGSRKHGSWFAPGDHREGQPIFDGLRGTDVYRDPPNWSTSLDAAKTLILPGWHWFVDSDGLASVFKDYSDEHGWFLAGAATDALALVAACLRAKLMEKEEGDASN